MLSLYNLFKQVILEGVRPTVKDVQNILNDTKAVNIVYNDGTKNPELGVRYCQVVALGETSKGNEAIRVYQIGGPNLKANKRGGKIEHWKTFRLDRIEGWNVTNFRFYAPPDELYNILGDKTLNIPNNNGLAYMATFGGKYLDNYRNRYLNWQSDLDTKQSNNPLKKYRADDNSIGDKSMDNKNVDTNVSVDNTPTNVGVEPNNNSNVQNYGDYENEPEIEDTDEDEFKNEI